MSADNYYVITKHPLGGYAAVMGFASDDEGPGTHEVAARVIDESFPTVMDALTWAESQYSEYGTSISPECREKYVPMNRLRELKDVFSPEDWAILEKLIIEFE